MIIEKDMPDTPGVENAEITFASHDFPVKIKTHLTSWGRVSGIEFVERFTSQIA